MTTIHTRQVQQYTQDNQQQHTQDILKYNMYIKVNNTKVRKCRVQFLVFSPTHIALSLSPQPFTSHHFTTQINFSHKVSFLPHSLHCTSHHFISFHFITLLDDFHFILLRSYTLLDDFQHTSSSFNSPRLSLSLPSFKNNWFAGESA